MNENEKEKEKEKGKEKRREDNRKRQASNVIVIMFGVRRHYLFGSVSG